VLSIHFLLFLFVLIRNGMGKCHQYKVFFFKNLRLLHQHTATSISQVDVCIFKQKETTGCSNITSSPVHLILMPSRSCDSSCCYKPTKNTSFLEFSKKIRQEEFFGSNEIAIEYLAELSVFLWFYAKLVLV